MNTWIVLFSLVSLEFVDAQLRIVGGSISKIEDWPFMVFIVFSKGSKVGPACGASLLSSQTILTAAHCLDDITNSKKNFQDYLLVAHMGHTDILKATLRRQVIDYMTHPGYSLGGMTHDIGVGFLAKPVAFSGSVKKVILRTTPLGDEEKVLLAAGWGAWKNPVDPQTPISASLKIIQQDLVPKEQCFAHVPALQDGNLCAGTAASDTYVFTGDSGGPLVTSDYQQVGVISYKFKEDIGRTVYTSIPDHVDWLAKASEHLFRANCRVHTNNTLTY